MLPIDDTIEGITGNLFAYRPVRKVGALINSRAIPAVVNSRAYLS